MLRPGRILGVIVGLVILAALWRLPITSTQYTFYEIVEPLLGAIDNIRNLSTEQMLFSYILIIAFILLVIAGLVGFFPLGTGVLGIIGMAMLTLAPYFVGLKVVWGISFYVLWTLSIVAVGASFWKKRDCASHSQVVNVHVQPPASPSPSPPSPQQSPPQPRQTITPLPPPPPRQPVRPSRICPVCGAACSWIEQYNRWYCPTCREYR